MNETDDARLRVFDEWIAAHGALVVRTARAFARGPGAGERDDLEQEILLAIWRAVPAFRGGSSVATFLYRVAHNAALTWRRAERGRSARELRVTSELARSHAATAPEESPDDDSRRLEALYAAIRELPPLDRSLVLLSLDGLPYAEMAEIHGISTNLVGVRLTRARRDLATLLQGDRR